MANGDGISTNDKVKGEGTTSVGAVGGGSVNAAKKPRLEPQDVKSMSAKQYIDELIVPTLLKAVNAANQKRPVDPLEYIANYLLSSKETVETPESS